MKPVRLVILGTALAAGIGAAVMVASTKPSQTARQVIVHASVVTEDVLVAAKALPIGTVVGNGDLRWQSWPKANVPPNVISKAQKPNAIAFFRASLVRQSLAAGEPVYPDRLIHAGNAGFMAAILPAGMRAVAINIDQQGSQTAGGFIHPDDHVDVILTYRDEVAAKAGVPNPMVSKTLLRNIKVLAIGQNIQTNENKNVVEGANATLELTPSQVETITLAQRQGQLSLALRSLADNTESQKNPPPTPNDMTIIRYGVAEQAQSH